MIPFNVCMPARPPFFTDRKDELSEAMQCLFAIGLNINVYGGRGIGKTSFLLALHDEIIKAYPDALVIFENLLSYVVSESVDLSRLILLSLADAIWEKVFKSTYSELIQLVGLPDPASAALSKEKRAFLRIFRLLRSGTIISQVEETAEIGGELVLSGKKGERHSSQYQIGGLYQFEFSRLLSELIAIVEKSREPRIVILFDEANYLREEQGQQLLRSNFDILLDSRIRYVFVTFEPAKKVFYEADKVLHREIRLGSFSNKATIDKLIDNHCAAFASTGKQVLEFSPGARQAIWDKFQGHPLRTIDLCGRAWENAVQKGDDIIDIEHVVAVL